LLKQIPRGQVTTYGRLATALGAVTAARWVATCLLDADFAAGCPAHRVVLQQGGLGSYFTRDPADKARRLHDEGVEVVDGKVDIQKLGFDTFESTQPLERLRQWQLDSLKHHNLQPLADVPLTVAGLDVSYASPWEAVMGYTLVDGMTAELLWSTTVRAEVRFPYIPSFLTFRELPVLLQGLEAAMQADRLGDVLIVDGAGGLHPRRAGIATQLGIVTGFPTIGVSKKRLCGGVDLSEIDRLEARPVVDHGETLAMALQTTPGGPPIYISPGHGIDVAGALEITRRLVTRHKLPEPTHWADSLSRRAARAR
jgi:deoxyribonuclease V